MYENLCEPWPHIWCGDISGVNPEVTGHAVVAASEVLWGATGRRFGNCPVALRPCRRSCVQFPPDTRVFDNGIIASSAWGWPFPTLIDGQFVNIACGICTDDCACTTTSEVVFPDFVRVESVVIDGATLPVSGWELYDGQRLVRTDGEEWPMCQDWHVTNGPGAWVVNVRSGPPVPTLGQEAVGILALEIAKMCCGMDCLIPRTAVQVTRQGVTFKLDDGGLTGLALPDEFIKTYNPNKIMDRARAWSPDVIVPRMQS